MFAKLTDGTTVQLKDQKSESATRFSAGPLYKYVLLVLGVLLIAAACVKFHHLATEPAEALSPMLTFCLVCIELQLGLLLLVGPRTLWMWRAAVTCFSAFALVAAYKVASGDQSCGCFGSLQVSPWITFTVDISALAALLLCWNGASCANHGWNQLNVRRIIASAIGLMLIGGTVVAYRQSQFTKLSADAAEITLGGLVVLEPESWAGEEFPLIKHAEIDADLSQGPWTVLLFQHGCPVCHEVMAQLERWLNDGNQPVGVALVSIDNQQHDELAARLKGLGCALGRLDPSVEWFSQTPLRIRLVDGRCVKVDQVKEW